MPKSKDMELDCNVRISLYVYRQSLADAHICHIDSRLSSAPTSVSFRLKIVVEVG